MTLFLGPTDDWQAKFDASGRETLVVLKSGVYPKFKLDLGDRDGVKVKALNDVILEGWEEITGWTDVGGKWKKTGLTSQSVIKFQKYHNTKSRGKRAFVPEELFRIPNGQTYPLRMYHVASSGNVTQEDEFYYNENTGELFSGADPATHTLYFSRLQYCITSDEYTKGVQILGASDANRLVVKGYANPWHEGAIHLPLGADDGKAQFVHCTLNHGNGLSIRGHRAQLLDSSFVDNGQLGFAIRGSNTTGLAPGCQIRRVVSAYNCMQLSVKMNAEAGGCKLYKLQDPIVDQLAFLENGGHGLWFDVDNQGTKATRIFTYKNAGAGIFHEIGKGGLTENFLCYMDQQEFVHYSSMNGPIIQWREVAHSDRRRNIARRGIAVVGGNRKNKVIGPKGWGIIDKATRSQKSNYVSVEELEIIYTTKHDGHAAPASGVVNFDSGNPAYTSMRDTIRVRNNIYRAHKGQRGKLYYHYPTGPGSNARTTFDGIQKIKLGPDGNWEQGSQFLEYDEQTLLGFVPQVNALNLHPKWGYPMWGSIFEEPRTRDAKSPITAMGDEFWKTIDPQDPNAPPPPPPTPGGGGDPGTVEIEEVSTGERLGSVGEEAGTGETWNNPDRAYSLSLGRSSCLTLKTGGSESAELRVSGFNLNIPTSHQIVGIIGYINRTQEKNSTSFSIKDHTVKLLKAGTPVGDNKAKTGVDWPHGRTKNAPTDYGGQNDLWGETWTPADINSDGFGLMLKCNATQGDAASNQPAYVYVMTLEVWHKPPLSGSTSSEQVSDTRSRVFVDHFYEETVAQDVTAGHLADTGVWNRIIGGIGLQANVNGRARLPLNAWGSPDTETPQIKDLANRLTNSQGEGGTKGSPLPGAGTPTDWWADNQSILTYTLLGTSVEDGVPVIDIRVQGTNGTGSSVSASIGFATSNYVIQAGESDGWTTSLWLKQINGTLPAATVGINQFDSGGVWQSFSHDPAPFTGNLKRFDHVIQKGASTQQLSPLMLLIVDPGQTVDGVLRIGNPQLTNTVRFFNLVGTKPGLPTFQGLQNIWSLRPESDDLVIDSTEIQISSPSTAADEAIGLMARLTDPFNYVLALIHSNSKAGANLEIGEVIYGAYTKHAEVTITPPMQRHDVYELRVVDNVAWLFLNDTRVLRAPVIGLPASGIGGIGLGSSAASPPSSTFAELALDLVASHTVDPGADQPTEAATITGGSETDTQVVFDEFYEASQNTNISSHTPDVGTGYTYEINPQSVEFRARTDSRLRLVAGGGTPSEVFVSAQPNASGNDQKIQIEILDGDTGTSNDPFLLILRFTDSNNYLMAWLASKDYVAASTIRLYEMVSGTLTLLDSKTETPAFTNGDTFMFKVVGDQAEVWLGGVQKLSATVSVATGSKWGFGEGDLSNDSARAVVGWEMDKLRCYDITVTGGTARPADAGETGEPARANKGFAFGTFAEDQFAGEEADVDLTDHTLNAGDDEYLLDQDLTWVKLHSAGSSEVEVITATETAKVDTAAANQRLSYHTLESIPGDDQAVVVEISAVATDANAVMALMARIQDSDNYIAALFYGTDKTSDNLIVGEMVGGGWTEIGRATLQSVLAIGDIIELTVSGTTVRVHHNEDSNLVADTTNLLTGDHAGFGLGDMRLAGTDDVDTLWQLAGIELFELFVEEAESVVAGEQPVSRNPISTSDAIPYVAPTFLVEIEAVEAGTGEEKVLRLTSGPGYNDPSAPGYFYPAIIDPGNFARDIAGQANIVGRSDVAFGEVIISNLDGVFDLATRWVFDGRTIRIRVGSKDDPFGAYDLIFSGTIEQVLPEIDRIRFRIRDVLELLDTPVQSELFRGDNQLPNGVEGTADDIKGQPKPACFGFVRNVEPPLVNASRLIYQVHTRAVNKIDTVYDSGVELSVGETRSTLQALQDNDPEPGFYDVYLGTPEVGSYFRLGSSPVGQITADIEGDRGIVDGDLTYSQTLGDIIAAMLEHSGTGIRLDSQDDRILSGTVRSEIGIWLDGETYLEAFDLLASSVGCFYAPDRNGILQVRRVAAPSDRHELTFIQSSLQNPRGINDAEIIDLQRLPFLNGNGAPNWRVNLGYRRNYTRQDRNALAGSVTSRAVELIEDYRRVFTEDPKIKETYPNSQELRIDTLLRDEADAQAEADRLFALYSVRRDRYRIRTRLDAIQASRLDLGVTVRVKFDRFNLNQGKLFLVTGLRYAGESQLVDVDLWG